MFSDQTPAVTARLKKKEKQERLLLALSLSYFKTATFDLRHKSGRKDLMVPAFCHCIQLSHAFSHDAFMTPRFCSVVIGPALLVTSNVITINDLDGGIKGMPDLWARPT